MIHTAKNMYILHIIDRLEGGGGVPEQEPT